MKYLYCIWCALAMTGCSLECYRVLQSATYKPKRGYFKLFFSWYFALLIVVEAFSWLWAKFFAVEAIICGVYSLIAIPIAFVRRKSPLKFTKRIVRMLCVNFLLLFFACVFALHWWFVFVPFFVLLSWATCLPLDFAINAKYLDAAKKKLRNSGVTVIAITGSYGKTSAKEMLRPLLTHSVSPEGSCNTPLGIAKFVNATDLSECRYLILEFGARQRGDISALCKLYQPHHGIITGICNQHLSTFKSSENIVREKGQLAKSLPPDGFCVLADESVRCFSDVGDCVKVYDCVRVSNLHVSVNGTDFDVCYEGKISHIKLPLITPHIAETFAACAALCLKLGESLEQIAINSKFIVKCPHRMEIQHNGEFFIIDDSYNASIAGVQGCCEVLRQLNGSKVAISQGIVECGKQSKQLNEKCGELLGRECDVLIFLGKNVEALRSGAQKSNCKFVLKAKNLTEAVQTARKYLRKDSVLLFQNDLPDTVNV